MTPLSVMARARLFNTGIRDPIKGPALLGRKPAALLEDRTIIPRGEIGVAKGGGEASRPYRAARHQHDQQGGLSQQRTGKQKPTRLNSRIVGTPSCWEDLWKTPPVLQKPPQENNHWRRPMLS
ncbi:MAG: hypothetical protein GY696_35530 [Gammaproteobacteria bacterium]|nr:hypothetical protein [Gammaproteobacteria bacterium]